MTHAAATALPGTAAWSQAYPGQADQIRLIRRDLRNLLYRCPAADDAILCASELAANAARHSDSAKPGGQLTVRMHAVPGSHIQIDVTDQGGRWDWRSRPPGGHDGLNIVHGMADDWGIDGDYRTRTTWALLGWAPGRTQRIRPAAARPASPAAMFMHASNTGGRHQWSTTINGHRLASLRTLHGLTRQQLAAYADLSPVTLGRLERSDTTRCHPRTTTRLAIALGEHPAAFTRTITQIMPRSNTATTTATRADR